MIACENWIGNLIRILLMLLKKLPVPLKSARGSEIYFDNDKRYESIFEHIANKNHHLTIKDIKAIPAILLDKNSLKLDRSGKKFST